MSYSHEGKRIIQTITPQKTQKELIGTISAKKQKASLTIVIPTYNRDQELKDCLNSIERNTVHPHKVLVLDDSTYTKHPNTFDEYDLDIQYIWKKVLSGTYKNYDPGLSYSRNLGIEMSETDYLLYIDDDIVLCEDYIEKLMDIWRGVWDKKILGVGGMVIGERKKGKIERFYNRIFFNEDKYLPWDVNRVGFPIWDQGIEEDKVVGYVNGGLLSLRLKTEPLELKYQPLRFRQRRPGRTPADEIEFCLRAKYVGYKFYISPSLKAFHAHSKAGKDSDFTIGVKEIGSHSEILNKLILRIERESYLYNKRIMDYMVGGWCVYHRFIASLICLKLRLYFLWGCVGWIGRQILAFRFSRAAGMILRSIKDLGVIIIYFMFCRFIDDRHED